MKISFFFSVTEAPDATYKVIALFVQVVSALEGSLCIIEIIN